MCTPPLDRSGRLIRQAAGKELVKYQPQRVDIAANAGLALSNLLGSHVSRSARSLAASRGVVAA